MILVLGNSIVESNKDTKNYFKCIVIYIWSM